jgi:hypothetical protein
MTEKFQILDYDIIYLSYDEPNAEKNYADLCKKIPWAKRVHGVKGSDAAHKACAEISETDRFITVDGDNIVNAEFLTKEFNLSTREDLFWNRTVSFDKCVVSWAAKNTINGLIYGNGGIKCWPKQKVLDMRTHENADPNNIHAQVDFCWDLEYIQVNECYSEIMNNSSAQQAWRAGFREGVKMCLNRGLRPKNLDEFNQNDWRNLHRIYIWLMVGADVDNGSWAVYGARQGLVKTMLSNWDYVNVRDFEWLNDFWNSEVKDSNVNDETILLGKEIVNNLNLPISSIPLDYNQSKFFKTVYQSPSRFNLIKNNKRDLE